MTQPAAKPLNCVRIRPATPADARDCLRVFQRAVLLGAGAAYTLAQRKAWASLPYNLKRWRGRQSRHVTLVAERDRKIIGFVECRGDGHVHMLFVDPAYVRQGLARRLLCAADEILSARGTCRRSTWASDISRPVFDREGYQVAGSKLAIARRQRLRNWRMVRH